MQVVNAKEAISKINNGDAVVLSGFVGCAVPEYILENIEKEFLDSGKPSNLTVVWDATVGTGKGNGVDHLAHKGLVNRAITSHCSMHPTMQKMIDNNEISAHILPFGCMSQLYRETGAGRPGFITKIGLNTFVDPRIQGGKANDITTEDIVEIIRIHGEEYLFFNPIPMNAAIIRGTTIDDRGNLNCKREAVLDDILVTAQAVKRNGGIVIAEVEQVASYGSLNPREVVVPGFMIDYAVVAPQDKHRQCLNTDYYNGSLAHEYRVNPDSSKVLPLDERKVIARRAALELKKGAIINLGFGVPTGVASVAAEEGVADKFMMTVECGHVGGVPAGEFEFGCCYNPDYVVDTCRQFEWYDGGALDLAYLGAAEIDQYGNANVSKFGRTVGPGGFINIAQTAKKVCYCGTLTAGGLRVAVEDGKVVVVNEGKKKKYINNVEQITFSGKTAIQGGQEVLYITERAVFKLTPTGLVITEIAPGIDLQTQLLDQIEFDIRVSSDLKMMDGRIFKDEIMGFDL